MLITTTCPLCGDTEDIYTPTKNFIDWEDGMLIQKAMPFLSDDDRERLVSGLCPACFDKMFLEENV